MIDATGERHAPAHRQDMAAWRAGVEDSVSLDYRATRCTSRPVVARTVFLQQLALLDGVDLAATSEAAPDHMQHGRRGGKLAFADREAGTATPTTSTCR